MDGLGAEVSQKIRSAIKAKLMELGAYVDEELPDYIMVMVVNKRSRAQMEGDLQLFLGSNTEEFTAWLHQVLQKLQEVTVASLERKRKSSAGEVEAVNNKKDKKKKPMDKKKDQTKPKDTKPDTAAVADNDQVVTGKQSAISEVKKSQGAMIDARKTRKSTDDLLKEPTLAVVNKGKVQERPVVEMKSAKTRQKIVLMQSDEDDDDDFINIKADAEAEELLDAELPKEAPEQMKSSSKATITITTNAEEPLVRTVQPVVEEQKSLPMSSTSEKSGVRESIEDKAISSSVTERVPLRRVISLKPEAKETTTKDKERSNNVVSRLGGRLGIRKNVSVAEVAPTRTINITKTVKLDAKQLESPPTVKRANETDVNKVPRKRPLLSRVVAMRKDAVTNEQKEEEEEEEEYDPSNPSVGSLASVVRVKPRPKIPAALQANKNLILKAVAEAHKSVANAPKRVDPSERPDGLFTRRFRDKKNQEGISIAFSNSKMKPRKEQQINEKPLDIERIVIPVKLEASRSISSVNLQQKIVIQVSHKTPNDSTESPEPDSTNFMQLETEECSDQALMEYEEESIKPLENELEIQEETKDDDLDTLIDYEPESTWDKELEKDLKPTSVSGSGRPHLDSPSSIQRSESPQFVVTLDGIDPTLFQGTKKSCATSTTQKETPKAETKRPVSPIVFTPTSTTTSTTIASNADTPKKKILERCKYWPACRSGDKCDYLHPTAPCKMFPNCKFGDKCLYIHPNCKFDASCTRRDCPYTHAIPRNLKNTVSRAPSSSATAVPTAAPMKGIQQVCKYFPRCSNTSCRYLHPKPCRYGRYCSRKKDCTFLHDEIPPAEKLKWFCPFRL